MVYQRATYLRFIKISFIVLFAVATEGITVSPALCPTNKIAPHRRALANNYGNPRTFGAFYDLLIPANIQSNQPNNLQEQPLADDPGDCGEIEDYDENDVSSATTESARRYSKSDNRFFLGSLLPFLRPPYGQNSKPPLNPIVSKPERPTRPTRPTYGFGGYFSGNTYRPPPLLYPSDSVKPVHEDGQEIPVMYRPGVVGGPLGHIVGVTQARPTNRPPESTSKLNSKYINNVRFSMLSSQAPNSNRRPRDRLINDANNGILGSFIDLFFK